MKKRGRLTASDASENVPAEEDDDEEEGGGDEGEQKDLVFVMAEWPNNRYLVGEG